MIKIQSMKSVIPKEAVQVLEWEPQEWVRNEMSMLNQFFIQNGIKKFVDDKKRSALRYELIKPMQSHYRNEDIYYSTPIARLDHFQVFTYNGKLYDCHGAPVTTQPLNFNTGAILVMTQEGTLFLSHKERGSVHHSTMLAAAPVAYACMLEVQDGKIIQEEVWSGHYAPDLGQQAQFHDRLNRVFYHDIPIHLVPILLGVDTGRDPTVECAISRKPLLEPVKLPCGHVFNLTSFLRCYQTRQVCPLDNKKVDANEIVFDEELYAHLKESHRSHVLDVRSRIAALDAKVIHLGLDDRDENLAAISTISNKAEVILLLKEGAPVRRIYEIAKTVGIFSGHPTYKEYYVINGRSVMPEYILGVEIVERVNIILRKIAY